MTIETIVPNVYSISLRGVSAFLIDDHGLTLIDTGMPGSASSIIDALKAIDKQPADIRHILLSHLHDDHTGSTRAIQMASGAKTYMHPDDAALFCQGQTMRPYQAAPGLVSRLFVNLVIKHSGIQPVKPVEIDGALQDGQELDFAGGLRVIHTPGHTAGHLAFLYPGAGGVLLCGDACRGLKHSFIYEDVAEGQRSLRKLAALNFETALFSHARPLRHAADSFKKKWA